MWDQRSKGWDQGSEGCDQKSGEKNGISDVKINCLFTTLLCVCTLDISEKIRLR